MWPASSASAPVLEHRQHLWWHSEKNHNDYDNEKNRDSRKLTEDHHHLLGGHRMEGALHRYLALVFAGRLFVRVAYVHGAAATFLQLGPRKNEEKFKSNHVPNFLRETYLDLNALKRKDLLLRLEAWREAKEFLLVAVPFVRPIEPLERVQRRVAQVEQARQLEVRALLHSRGHIQRHQPDRVAFCAGEGNPEK